MTTADDGRTRRRLACFPVLLVLVPGAAAQGWLDAPLRPEAAQAGELRAHGDFEGDGDVDLLWFEGAGVSWTGFRVFLNDGAGGFTPGPLVPLAESRRAVYGELCDVTGDGLADVLVNVAPPNGEVEIHPGAAGATFQTPLTFTTPGLVGHADDYAWGDIDGDGVAEIATRALTSFDNDVEIRWWDFTGGAFVPSAAVPILAPGAAGMAVLDVNDDGLADLVLGDQVGDELRLLPTVDGAPTLGTSVALGLPTSTCRIYPLVGDLDGDADLDLVASSLCSGQWLVPVVQEPAGTFTALTAQELEGWSFTDHGRPGAAVDWDGDGDLDVLSHNGNINVGLAQRGTLWVLRNDGDHAFELAAEITTAFETPREAVGPADLDGDGRADFVALRTLAFGNGRFEDVLPRFAFPGFPLEPDDAAVALDWEGDGDLDVFRKGTGTTAGTLYENDASGRFSARFPLPDPPAGNDWGGAEAIADLSGDGRPDLLVRFTTEGDVFTPPGFVEMRLLADDGLGGFVDAGSAAPAGEELLGDAKGLLLAVDLDADGDLDLLDLHPGAPGEPGGAWTNDGTGALSGFDSHFAGEPLAAADVDADGDVDVITRESVGPGLLVLERQGPGGFTDEIVFNGNFGAETPVLLDLDLDGDADLAAGEVGVPIGLAVFENVSGVFALASLLPASPLSDEWIGAEDVSGDGIPDLLSGRGPDTGSSGGSVDHLQIFRGLGSLAYEPARTYVGRRLSGFADLDGDGDVDLFGRTVSETRRYAGRQDGIVRQFGKGTPGAGGAVPVLGATGPIRPGSTTAKLHLRRCVGGATGWLTLRAPTGFLFEGPATLPRLAGGGGSGRTQSSDALGPLRQPIVLDGTPGVPGEGSLDLDLTPLLAQFAGQTWTLQVTIVDPAAASGRAKSNRLRLVLGYGAR